VIAVVRTVAHGLVLRRARAGELAPDREDLLRLVDGAVGVLVEEAGDELGLVVEIGHGDRDDLAPTVDLVDALLEVLGPFGELVRLVDLVPVDRDVGVLGGGPALVTLRRGARRLAADRNHPGRNNGDQDGSERLEFGAHGLNLGAEHLPRKLRRTDGDCNATEFASQLYRRLESITSGDRPA